MTERLFAPDSCTALSAPFHIRTRAHQERKFIKQIIWDKEGGYPEHAWGYIQWSIRPYAQRYGCDGTTDANIHLIALRFCQALQLDYPTLYEKAYEWQGEKPGKSWLRTFNWQTTKAETIVPELSEQALRNLLSMIWQKSTIVQLLRS